nr:immunoglobulin heavy chain junction region [Macaca mulatta]MOV92115.1 immunoglobulin heavy chain junction region [Macaca mulatta]
CARDRDDPTDDTFDFW